MPKNEELDLEQEAIIGGPKGIGLNGNGIKKVIPPFWPPRLLDDFENYAVRNK
jgi:hypothetical protein